MIHSYARQRWVHRCTDSLGAMNKPTSPHATRMGKTENPDMLFNLDDLIQSCENLEELSAPFTTQEIDGIMKEMSNDKSPGPNGFNGLFIKKCWHLIKEDFYQLYEDFYNGTINLQAINNCFITLIPKVNNPVSVNDYRPIFLLNCVLKLLTKLLANRLQSMILSLIHKNQYGFIKNRTIQDCLGWAYEYYSYNNSIPSKAVSGTLQTDSLMSLAIALCNTTDIETIKKKGFNSI
jgi:hypothetical protein